MIFLVAIYLVAWVSIFIWIDQRIDLESKGKDVNVPSSADVVIAMRNEETNILQTLQALNCSEGLTSPINVIIVDDLSTDHSYGVVEEHKDDFSNLTIDLYKSEAQGKKAALNLGVSKASSEYIFLTDADCQVSPKGIARLINHAHESEAKVVYGPVFYHGQGYWGSLLIHENLNNQLTSEALIRANTPVMVNAANMLMHKSAIGEYQQSLLMESASGDDVFFALNTSKDELAGLFELDAGVWTDAPNSLRDLLSQRLRWASKSRYYPSGIVKLIAPVFFILNAFYLVLLGALLLNANVGLLLLLLCLKISIEWSYHRRWFYKYSANVRIFDSIALSVLHPMYTIYIGVLSMVSQQFEWKGRYHGV